jgi:hypothetical protein
MCQFVRHKVAILNFKLQVKLMKNEKEMLSNYLPELQSVRGTVKLSSGLASYV